MLIRFAREWGTTAEHTDGKCTIIIGAGINHWYHANLMYRAGIHALMFCGCVGKNGGGLAHYVGQEKLAPAESWASIALAKDWYPAVALAERAELALRPLRPVALREGLHRLPHRPAATRPRRQHGPGPHDGHAGPRRAQRLAAVLSAVPREPARCRQAGARGRCANRPKKLPSWVAERLKNQ